MGLLILIGVTKENHESVGDLWSSGPLGRQNFKAVMPVNRFEKILQYLRFDYFNTRADQRSTGELAPY